MGREGGDWGAGREDIGVKAPFLSICGEESACVCKGCGRGCVCVGGCRMPASRLYCRVRVCLHTCVCP